MVRRGASDAIRRNHKRGLIGYANPFGYFLNTEAQSRLGKNNFLTIVDVVGESAAFGNGAISTLFYRNQLGQKLDNDLVREKH